jgi:hypothetical protein
MISLEQNNDGNYTYKKGRSKQEKYINRNLHTLLTKYLLATCWETMLWNV